MVTQNIQNILEKPKKARVLRILKKKEPQLIENTKNTLIFKGRSTSQSVIDIMHELSLLKKPNCKQLSRKNEILPFEDPNSVEFLTSKNDCSLFLMGSHSKKRQNNLVFGRTFDGHVLDMAEFGVSNFQGINNFEGFKKGLGSKPLLLFHGGQWESDSIYKRLQNLFIDFFRGDKPEKVSLKGLDHALSFHVVDGIIHFRSYTVIFKKSGTKIPNVVLKPMGPYFDLSMRRNKFASDELWKVSCRKPKQLKVMKKKNVKRSDVGETVGRIHIGKQDISKIAGKLMPVLRKRNPIKSVEEDENRSNKRRRIRSQEE